MSRLLRCERGKGIVLWSASRSCADLVGYLKSALLLRLSQLLLYDSLGLAEPGKAHEMVRKGDNTYGGKFVVNPSGGLESKGHPLGATVSHVSLDLAGCCTELGEALTF